MLQLEQAIQELLMLVSDFKAILCQYQNHTITHYFTACEIIIKCSFTTVCRIYNKQCMVEMKLEHPSRYSGERNELVRNRVYPMMLLWYASVSYKLSVNKQFL